MPVDVAIDVLAIIAAGLLVASVPVREAFYVVSNAYRECIAKQMLAKQSYNYN